MPTTSTTHTHPTTTASQDAVLDDMLALDKATLSEDALECQYHFTRKISGHSAFQKLGLLTIDASDGIDMGDGTVRFITASRAGDDITGYDTDAQQAAADNDISIAQKALDSARLLELQHTKEAAIVAKQFRTLVELQQRHVAFKQRAKQSLVRWHAKNAEAASPAIATVDAEQDGPPPALKRQKTSHGAN